MHELDSEQNAGWDRHPRGDRPAVCRERRGEGDEQGRGNHNAEEKQEGVRKQRSHRTLAFVCHPQGKETQRGGETGEQPSSLISKPSTKKGKEASDGEEKQVEKRFHQC